MKFNFTFLLCAMCIHAVWGLNNPLAQSTILTDFSLTNLEESDILFNISNDTVLVPVTFQIIYPAGQSLAYEKCSAESFIRVSRTNADTSQPLTVPVIWSGTATANVDYLLPPSSLFIPAGKFFIDKPIFVFFDGVAEPLETVVITLNDSCACVTDTLRIQDIMPLSATVSNAYFQPGETATLTPIVTGGAPPFSYLWSNDSTTMSITTGTTGIYFVTVTDQCGQTAIDGATVSHPDTSCTYEDPVFLLDGAFAELPLVIHNALNPTLGANGQGLCGVKLNFDHEYIGDLTITLKSPSGQVITLVGPTGFFGPTDYDNWVITFLPCSATAEPDSGFLAHWDNNQRWGLSNEYTGSYYPFNGCLDSLVGPVNGTWTVTVLDAQAIDAGNFYYFELLFCDPTGINCAYCNTSAPITYTKPNKVLCIDDLPYTWEESPHTVLTGSGTYELSSSGYTTVNGCDSTVKQTITILNPYTSIVSLATQLNCSRNSITLFSEPFFGSPGVSVKTWTNLNTGETTKADTYTVGTPGNYVLTNTVTYDSTSCSYSDTITITSDPNLLEMFAIGGNQGCAGNIVQLDYYPGNAFWNFTWTGPNGFTSNNSKPYTDIPGDYTLMVSNGQGCSASSVATVIPGAPAPNVTAQGGMLDCQTGFTQIFGNSTTPGVNYFWNGPNGFFFFGQNPFVSVSGVYALEITAPNGCSNFTQVVVTDPPPSPSIGLVTPVVVSCAVPAQLVCLTNAAMPSFYWSGPENFSSTEPKPTVYLPGLYTIIVTDGVSHCTASVTLQVEGDTTTPVFQILQVVQPSNGQNNGSINISTSGAPGPVSYLWYLNGYAFPYAFTEDIENLAAGYYSCIAIAANGCSNSINVILENTIATHTISDVSPWHVRPNPGSGHFMLYSNTNTDPICQLRVYESGGRLIQQQSPGKMQDEYSIDLTDEAEGVYFLEVRGDEGSVWMKLVVAR